MKQKVIGYFVDGAFFKKMFKLRKGIWLYQDKKDLDKLINYLKLIRKWGFEK